MFIFPSIGNTHTTNNQAARAHTFDNVSQSDLYSRLTCKTFSSHMFHAAHMHACTVALLCVRALRREEYNAHAASQRATNGTAER